MLQLCNPSVAAGSGWAGRFGFGFRFPTGILLVGILAAMRLFGQATEGSILGTVTDTSGGALVNVQITVTNVQTNAVRTTFTNESGEYVVTNVPLGSYSVSAESKGFKRAVQPPLAMTVKARVRVDLHLEVGEVSQSVEITGTAPLLRTDTAEVSTLVTREQLDSLPSLDRHFLSLQVLTPGTYRQWHGINDRIGDFSGGESMQVGNAGSGQNNFILDGVSNNVELTGGLNAVPATDSIQEFSIQTNGYSAEFGRAGGSVVNVALKSGTNSLHGFAYDYLQNNIFNARPYDFTGTNPPITPLHKNLFGGGLGGPVIKNRIFLFGNYEGLRMPQNVLEYDTVPTALERTGDFSKSGWTVYDPATTNTAGARTAFPGNVIPANRINPLMQKLVGIFPTPNYKDPNPSVLSNYLATDINNDTKDAMNVKGDVNLRTNDTMTARYSKQWYTKDRSGYMPGSWIGGHATLNGTNAGLTETHVFSPSLVNEARVGWNYIADGNLNSNPTVITELSQIPGGIVEPGYPTISIRNLSSTKAVRPLTTLPTPYYVWQNSLQYMDNLSWHKGKHSIKGGFDFTHNRNDVGGGWAPGGVKFNFDGYQSVATVGGSRPSNLTGTPDALLGLVNQLTTYYTFDKTRMQVNRTGLFLQDEWRPTRKLSLSLGLRYENFPNWNFPRNQTTNFDLTAGQILVPVEGKAWVQSFLGLPGGALPPTYQYRPMDQVVGRNTGTDVSPRLGFAYSLTDKIVIRGGYGIFYAFEEALDTNNTNGAPFNFQVQLTGSTASPIVVSQGFPSSGIYNTLASNAIPPTQFPLTYKDPYLQKYGLNVQYSPFAKTLLDVGFEGNHDLGEPYSWRLNYPTPAPGDLQPRRPYPQFGEGFGFFFVGYSHYNALDVTLRQQAFHGLAIYSTLTVEHSNGDYSSPDPYNFNYGRGMLSYDFGHQWVTSFIYDVPFHRGNRLVRTALGGWQAATIIQIRGGLPFSIASSQAMNDDINGSRANLVVTNGSAALSSDKRNINNWFNAAAFSTPANYTWGNSGQNILRAPGFNEVEFSLQKTFPIFERYKVTFRAEAENLLNQVNLGAPSATLGAAGFNTIRSLNGDPRMIQMALKFAF